MVVCSLQSSLSSERLTTWPPDYPYPPTCLMDGHAAPLAMAGLREIPPKGDVLVLHISTPALERKQSDPSTSLGLKAKTKQTQQPSSNIVMVAQGHKAATRATRVMRAVRATMSEQKGNTDTDWAG